MLFGLFVVADWIAFHAIHDDLDRRVEQAAPLSALVAILALAPPLALKIGQRSALLAPMATAIISGLIVGAPLVLVAAPILHASLRRSQSGGEESQLATSHYCNV